MDLPTHGRERLGVSELTRDEKLEVCVKKIFHTEGVPPFSKHASELMLRALDPEAKCSELARIIVRDLGLSSHILRLANSAWYNRSGRPVMSVAHGIMLLGWDTVRNLVSTVPYVEHFLNRAPGLRQLMLMAVLTAEHTRRLASLVGYPNPDEAYLCGLFANLGEVLVACHCGREYSEIILNMHLDKIPAGAACMRVLDFTWQELGLQVAMGWKMPGKIVQCLTEKGDPSRGKLHGCLFSITQFAQVLTNALYRDGSGIEAVHLQCVADANGHKSLISVRDLRAVVDGALQDAEKSLYALQMETESLRLDRQAEEAVRLLESVPAFNTVAVKMLDQAIEGVNRTIRHDEFDLNEVITRLLDALCETGFGRVVFGLMNEQHTAIRGRLWAGDGEAARRFQLPAGATDEVLLSALEAKLDVIVDRCRDPRYDGTRLINALNPNAFALLPIMIGDRLAGCLYADTERRASGIESMRCVLGRVRNAIAVALTRKTQRNQK